MCLVAMGTHVLRPMFLLTHGTAGPAQEQTTRHHANHPGHHFKIQIGWNLGRPHEVDRKAAGTSQPTDGSIVWKTA